MEKQEQLIEQDQDDLQLLQAQIKKVQKLKNNYLEQKKQIEGLQIKISHLKNQNAALKSKEVVKIYASISNHQEKDTLNNKNQLATHASEFYSGDPQSNHGNSQSMKSGLVHANANSFKTNRQQNSYNKTQERFYSSRMLSPQPHHYQNSNRNNLNHTVRQRQKKVGNSHNQILRIRSPQAFRMDLQQSYEISHQQNLHRQVRNNLINSFVQDLHTEIQEKNSQLKKQRKNNINAQRQIQILKQEVQRLRIIATRQNQASKENIILKQQLQNQISEKIALKQQVSSIKKELLYQRQRSYRMRSQYDTVNMDYGECFDQELSRMDQIYAHITRIIKH